MGGRKDEGMNEDERNFDKIAKQLKQLSVNIAELEEDPENARLHSERNLRTIADSLARFGQRKPIVGRKVGSKIRIMAGSGTLLAARDLLKWTEIAVVVMDDDESTAQAFGIADNRTAELATWDDKKLLDMLVDIRENDLAGVGFDDKEIDRLIDQFELEDPIDDDVDVKAKTSTCPKCGFKWRK